MKNSIRIILFFIISAFSIAFNIAFAESLERAITAALDGPEVKKLNVYGHHFNIKKAQVLHRDQKVVISGQISHHLSHRPDDQIYYTIVKDNGAIVSVERKISNGGFINITAPLIAAAGSYFSGVPIPASEVKNISNSINKSVGGSWEEACDAIIGNIAIFADLPASSDQVPPVQAPHEVETTNSSQSNKDTLPLINNITPYPMPNPTMPMPYPMPYPMPNPTMPMPYPMPNPTMPMPYPMPNPTMPMPYPMPNSAMPMPYPRF